MGAISSVIDSNEPEEIQQIIDSIPDPVGTFYRYGLAESIMGKARIK